MFGVLQYSSFPEFLSFLTHSNLAAVHPTNSDLQNECMLDGAEYRAALRNLSSSSSSHPRIETELLLLSQSEEIFEAICIISSI